MGLSAGPVPSRVDACVKAGLLDLVDHAADAGWSPRRAAARLGIDDSRLARWQHRRVQGELTDRVPGGAPLHGLLAAERAAILELFTPWGDIDRSHRKLAHRGSRLDLVHVSESTVLRVLAAEGIALPGNPRRDPVPRTPRPDWLEWKPNRIWAYDFDPLHPGPAGGDRDPGRDPGEDLPDAQQIRATLAFGRGAQVLMDGDVVFLSVFGDHWLITAAGCTARGDRPYDCTVMGG